MLRGYFAALFHNWMGKMSGPFSVILLFLPIIFPRFFADSKALTTAIWIAAAICFMVANFSAWRYEHDRYIAEVSKNQKPEIIGQAHDFKATGRWGDDIEHGLISTNCEIRFDLTLCNHRHASTNLANVAVLGRLLSRTVMTRDLRFESVRLDYGIAVCVPVTLFIQLNSIRSCEMREKELDLKDLRVYAVDGLGTYHGIPIPDEETLFLGNH